MLIGFDFDDITYHRAIEHGTVRIAFNRPEVRNAPACAPSTSSIPLLIMPAWIPLLGACF